MEISGSLAELLLSRIIHLVFLSGLRLVRWWTTTINEIYLNVKVGDKNKADVDVDSALTTDGNKRSTKQSDVTRGFDTNDWRDANNNIRHLVPELTIYTTQPHCVGTERVSENILVYVHEILFEWNC